MALLLIFSIFAVEIFLPTLDIKKTLPQRIESFIYKDTFSESYETRWEGAQTEFHIWLNNSPLILGVGSSLPPEFESVEIIEIKGAPYHVGFTTYLVHYGLLGIITYLILLPITTIKIAKFYYTEYSIDTSSRIALIAMASSLADLVGMAWSYHHIGGFTHVAGFIYGAMWGLYRTASKNSPYFKNKRNFLKSYPGKV